MQEPQVQKISPIYLLIARHLHLFGRDVSLENTKEAAEEIINNAPQTERKPQSPTPSHPG